jgi:sugar/nucleoside kinase (ribokinase family)
MNTNDTAPVGLFVGLATIDIIHGVARMPSSNEKITATAQALAGGGPAANAAVTFAHRGGRATLASVVGRHRLTEIIRADMDVCGVRIMDAAPERDEPPPVSVIAVSAGSGDRSVVAHYAEAGDVDVPDELLDLAQRCDVVLVDGHHPVLAAAAVDAARRSGRRTVLDGGRWRPSVEALLPGIDVAVCSADFRPPGCRDDSDVFGYLTRWGVRWAAVTHGGGTITWRGPVGHGEVLVPAVDVADTLGAGDVFHGAFCHEFATRTDLTRQSWFAECLARATVDASRSCASFGSRSWLNEPGFSRSGPVPPGGGPAVRVRG